MDLSLETDLKIGVLIVVAIFAGFLRWMQYRESKTEKDKQ